MNDELAELDDQNCAITLCSAMAFVRSFDAEESFSNICECLEVSEVAKSRAWIAYCAASNYGKDSMSATWAEAEVMLIEGWP